MLTKEQLDEIIAKYNRGEDTGYTDEEYDALLEEYLKANGGESARPFNRQNQSAGVNAIVGTLPKCYGIQSAMRENQLSYEKWLSKKNLPPDTEVCVQAKFDGCSVAVDLLTGRFFTRGDYDNGESVDVTELFEQHMTQVKMCMALHRSSVAMKFEAILDRNIFYDMGFDKIYKRPRDFVSATITSRNVENAKYITLIPLRGYDEQGRQYIPSELCNDTFASLRTKANDFETIENFIKNILDDDASMSFTSFMYWTKDSILSGKYDVDGVVISPYKVYQNDGIYTDPDNEIAVKILYNVQKTKLLSVEYQFGKQGRITPVAILEPVYFGNVKVDHVTLSTMDRIMEMKLQHNDTVRVMYNIVPYLIDSEHDGDYPIQLPKRCPMCNSPLEFPSLRQVRCTNPDCCGLRLGSIVRFAEKMKMMGVSKGILQKLYAHGVITSIPDMLRLKPEQFNKLPGFGDVSANNIVKSIRDSSTNVSVTRCLGALPITDISEETWKIIVKTIGEGLVISELRAGTFVDLMVNFGYIPTVGDLKMRKIIDGYIQHRAEIQEILSLVTFKQAGPAPWKEHMGRVCLTGTRDEEITKALEDSGYEVGGFSKDCVFVVIPYEGFTSAKTEKAKELGIPVYTIEYVKWHEIKPF